MHALYDVGASQLLLVIDAWYPLWLEWGTLSINHDKIRLHRISIYQYGTDFDSSPSHKEKKLGQRRVHCPSLSTPWEKLGLGWSTLLNVLHPDKFVRPCLWYWMRSLLLCKCLTLLHFWVQNKYNFAESFKNDASLVSHYCVYTYLQQILPLVQGKVRNICFWKYSRIKN